MKAAMVKSYYLWKWANNALPGKPQDVMAALMRGQMHPALQPFDPQHLVKALERAAKAGRKRKQEWSYQVQPADDGTKASFVFVTAPEVVADIDSTIRFERDLASLGLSGADEEEALIVEGLLPKLNSFKTGQDWAGPVYDVGVEDLAVLIRSVDASAPDPFAVLTDHRGHFVQFYRHGRRFCVEWRENHDTCDWTKFDHWRAQDPKRLAALPVEPDKQAGLPEEIVADLLTYSVTLKIFCAFLEGRRLPAIGHWRHYNRELIEILKKQKVK